MLKLEGYKRLQEELRLLIDTSVPDMGQDQYDSTRETPGRFLKAFFEMTQGYDQDPEKILSKRFKQDYDEMVVVNDINFTSLCEHHLLPFIGIATVGYIPQGTVVGLSKIPRLVDCFSRRLQIQERLTNEIAEAMNLHLQPKGVGVIIEAQHQCMSCRGVRKQNAKMITSAMRGVMLTNPSARSEFLNFK
jgi:GTP cyclohydrolase IA